MSRLPANDLPGVDAVPESVDPAHDQVRLLPRRALISFLLRYFYRLFAVALEPGIQLSQLGGAEFFQARGLEFRRRHRLLNVLGLSLGKYGRDAA